MVRAASLNVEVPLVWRSDVAIVCVTCVWWEGKGGGKDAPDNRIVGQLMRWGVGLLECVSVLCHASIKVGIRLAW